MELGIRADTSDANFHYIGSLTSHHARSASQSEPLACQTRGQLPAERLLPLITAIVQSYGVHDNLIDQNIGGLIFGLRTQGSRILWQEDTNFVIYPPELENSIWVPALARANVNVVNVPLTKQARYLHTREHCGDSRNRLEKWQTSVRQAFDGDNYRYWFFISALGKNITVLERCGGRCAAGLPVAVTQWSGVPHWIQPRTVGATHSTSRGTPGRQPPLPTEFLGRIGV